MGAKLTKISFETQNRELEDQISLSEEMKFLSRKELKSDFNKLYLNSRDELKAITTDPSEEMLTNINRCVRKNSKFMENCFNEVTSNCYDIVDLVTDRLSYDNIEYKIASMESKHIENFLRTNRSYVHEKRKDL